MITTLDLPTILILHIPSPVVCGLVADTKTVSQWRGYTSLSRLLETFATVATDGHVTIDVVVNYRFYRLAVLLF